MSVVKPPCRCYRVLVYLGLLVVAAGCGRGEPKVVEVSGTVTRGGKPVPNLFLNFMPEKGRPSWGITNAEGRYTLNYDQRHVGAVVGTHKVFVVYRPRDPGEEAALATGGARIPQDLSAILQKYGKIDTTPLQVEVKEKGQVIDLALD